MNEEHLYDIPRIAILPNRGCLTASIQVELSDAILDQFQRDLLARIEDSEARGVVVDLAGVSAFDQRDFSKLQGILQMASLMGCEAILSGIPPGVVSYLAECEIELKVQYCLGLDEAIQQLTQKA